jgi:hypothetical protein
VFIQNLLPCPVEIVEQAETGDEQLGTITPGDELTIYDFNPDVKNAKAKFTLRVSETETVSTYNLRIKFPDSSDLVTANERVQGTHYPCNYVSLDYSKREILKT